MASGAVASDRGGKAARYRRQAAEAGGSGPDHGPPAVDTRQQAGGESEAVAQVAQLVRTGPAGEEAGRAEASRQDRGAKGRRATIAQETLQILEAGGYRQSQGEAGWVDVREAVAAAVAASSFHAAGPWQLARAITPPGGGQSSIEVRRCYVLDAAESLARCAGAKVGVLNFASARNPGGGFTTGAEAQEESIARSSALYPCLMKHFHDFFVPHRNARSGAYTHALIYSSGVPVIRDSTGALLDNPYLADFVTAAAPNRGTMIGKDPAGDAERALHERAHRVLSAFAHGGVSDLVLGAWGCGVFKNDPRTVASIFADHLGHNFRGCFRSVVFAVPDDANASVFEVVFGASARTSGKGAAAGRSSGEAAAVPDGGAKLVTAAGQVASSFSQAEKEFMKFAKAVREILEIERKAANGHRVELTQTKRVEKKAVYLQELRRLEQGLDAQSDVRAKCKDVLAFLASDASVLVEQDDHGKEG